jgi:hypothetical protein
MMNLDLDEWEARAALCDEAADALNALNRPIQKSCAQRWSQGDMRDSEGTIARPPDSVRCENPKCGESILLDESLFSPDVDTPKSTSTHATIRKSPPSHPSVDIVTISR